VAHGDSINTSRFYLVTVTDLSQWGVNEKNVFIVVIKKQQSYFLK
jgi:hypothetical protein